MTKEANIIILTIILAIIFAMFLSSLNPNKEPGPIQINEPIPEPDMSEKVYEKYEMGNYS